MIYLTGEELSGYIDVSIRELRITGGESFKGLERFVNLTYLDCCDTNITEIHKELVNLTHLSCSNTKISEIHKELVNLTHLSCENTNISEIPKELNKLTELYCKNTNITEIPSELKNLTQLSCSNTNITEIPKELINLIVLYCSNTNITEIPCEINKLTILVCENTNITEFPNDLLVKLYNKSNVDKCLKENKYRIEFLKLKKKLILNNTLTDIPNELKELIKNNKYYEGFEKQEIGKVFLKIKRLNLDLPKELLNIVCDYCL
jgi:Leucine-rich repeat (LRR) protein